MLYALTSKTYAQNNQILNPDPAHFLINKGQILPSSYSIDKSLLSAVYQNKAGMFSDIRNLYVDGLFKTGQAHTLGIKVYSEQETSLFSKSKILFVYGYTLNIREDMQWTSAAQVGFANINFGASAASGGGGAWNWDASVATTLEYRTWELALGMNQIPSSKLRPINYEFQLGRYIDAYISKTFTSVDSLYNLETGIRSLSNTDTTVFYLDNTISYRNFVGALLMISSNKRMSMGGHIIIPYKSGKFQLVFDYGFSFAGLSTNQGMYTVGLYYKR